jgi:hypothetical protein
MEEIVTRRTANQIAFGSLGHKALQVFLSGGSFDQAKEETFKEIKEKFTSDLMPDQVAEVNQIGNDALAIASKYSKILLRKFTSVAYGERSLPMIELPIQVTIQGIDFVGTPDWIASDSSGTWVLDHKFRKTFRPPESEDLNLQMAFYQGLVWHRFGIDTIGSRQIQIKPLLPKEPEITKLGKISKKDTMTDWETYSKFVISQGEDPNDYLDMKEKLDKHVWIDYESTAAYRSNKEVTKLWNDMIIPIAHEILEAKEKNKTQPRCMQWGTCQSCDYKDYCVEDIKGGDLEFLRNTTYKRKGETSFTQLVIVEE